MPTSSEHGNEFVSNACYGFNLYRTLLKFPAQMRHMDIHGTGLTVKVEAPGFLQDLLTAEDESAMFGEGQEKVKFLGAQVKALRREMDFTSRRVNCQIAEMNRSRAIR